MGNDIMDIVIAMANLSKHKDLNFVIQRDISNSLDIHKSDTLKLGMRIEYENTHSLRVQQIAGALLLSATALVGWVWYVFSCACSSRTAKFRDERTNERTDGQTLSSTGNF